VAENQESESSGGNSGYRWYVLMNVKVVVAILLIAAVPLCAQAQKPSAVTRADAQRVLKTISGDKAKTRTYCDIAKLVNKITEGDEEQTNGLYEKIDELGKNWVPNMPRWLTDFRTLTHNPKSVRRCVRPWMPSIICVGGNAPSGWSAYGP
jgi:hypothetical protein